MYKSIFRHIKHLYGNKVLTLVFVALVLPGTVLAQRNYLEYINKRIYFGITLGFNVSDFKIGRTKDFINADSIQSIHSAYGPGFNLGIVSNLRMGKYFDLRFLPSLAFAGKNIDFTKTDKSVVEKKIESIIIDFPLEVRFKSQPIGDIRVYVLTGMKYSIDLASNAKSRKAEDQVRVRASDVAVEAGMGLQFFFPLFVFSPEIKFSYGVLNLHAPNNTLIYSNVIDNLNSRTIMICFHFEG